MHRRVHDLGILLNLNLKSGDRNFAEATFYGVDQVMFARIENDEVHVAHFGDVREC
jgi:hypothetical protein